MNCAGRRLSRDRGPAGRARADGAPRRARPAAVERRSRRSAANSGGHATAAALRRPVALLAALAAGRSMPLPARAAASCARRRGPAERVLSRLPSTKRAAGDSAIRSWIARRSGRRRPSIAFAAAGPEEAARVLRVSYRLDPAGRARAGVRIELDGLDASAYDHLEFRVRGDPAAGFARSFEVGFQRPRPDRPDMMENGSYVVDRRQRSVALRPGAAQPDDRDPAAGPGSTSSSSRSIPGAAEVAAGRDLRRRRRADQDRPARAVDRPIRCRRPRKDAWEQAHGGKDAARARARRPAARLARRARPRRRRSAPTTRAFLMQVARDTWRGLAALVDREHGLPVDHVGVPGRHGRPGARPGRRLHQPEHRRDLADGGRRRRASSA